jgi:hypothetical protein
VPGHKTIAGNECTDLMAKHRSEIPFVGTKPTSGIPDEAVTP